MIVKTGKQYWVERVYRPKRKGEVRWVENYAIKLQHAGQRMTLSLGTPNQSAAADRAREMYVFLQANGWEEFLQKYRPQGQVQQPLVITLAGKSHGVTIGDFLRAVRAESELSEKTIVCYEKCLRLVVAEVSKIQGTRKRFDYRAGGLRKWKEKVNAVPLGSITPDGVRAWKRLYVAKAGTDELARRRRTVSVNSYLRQARALFSKNKVLDKLRSIQMPETLPFDGISLERRTDTKFYGCGIEALPLMRLALDELAGGRVEELKAFLLAITLGLRRKEADLLEWRSFDFTAGTLRIMPTQWYQLKTNESASALLLEPEVLELFRGWRAKAKGVFVLESSRPPKAVRYQYYRCQETFERLLTWLREQGVEGPKPLHQLRKLFGSALADQYGLHAASSGLRHADIRTTFEFYASRVVKVTPGFGVAISGASVEPFPAAAVSSK
jgi:integrase